VILNHTIEALLDRRSIREFRPEQISEEELTDILYTAKFAPSTMGLQERHFTVIQNKQLLADIVSAALRQGADFSPTDHPFYHAPTVIVFSAKEASSTGTEDAALAAMNLMIAAQAYGLGTCYIGSVIQGLRDKSIMERLKLPEGYLPVNCISVGYPSEHAPAPDERRTDDVSYVR
jgi:nitroreductase